MNHQPQKIPGGVVYQIISPSDPAGNFYVRCDKHPKNCIQVIHNYFEVGYATKGTLYDLSLDALAKCAQCVAEKKEEAGRSWRCPQEEHDACGCPQ